MKRLTTLLAIAACVTAGFAQSKTSIFPESFELDGAVTSERIETLFANDGRGMYLEPIYDGPNTPDGQYQVGIELVGHTSRHPTMLSFGVGQTAYAGGDAIIHRIEMFNYVSGQWHVAASAFSGGVSPTRMHDRPYLPPLTVAQVQAEDFINPETGQVKTRVTWTSPRPFVTIYIDFAGWEQGWK